MRFFRHFVRCSLLICCIILLFLPSVSAHRGRTDSRGGHIDHSTGEYHYHHGYSAHQHTDLNGDGIPDCPYDFDDQTGSASGSSSSRSSSQHLSSISSSNPPSDDSFLSSLPPALNFVLGLLALFTVAAVLSFVFAIIIVLIDKLKNHTRQ